MGISHNIDESQAANTQPFTPGPWWLDDATAPDYIFANDGMVAEIRGHGAGLPQVANARLIAAAPEMYAALEALYAGVSDLRRKGLADSGNLDGQVWMTPVLLGTLRKIHAALKAAQGDR